MVYRHTEGGAQRRILMSCLVLSVRGWCQSVREVDNQYRSLLTTPGTDRQRHRRGQIDTAPHVSTLCEPDVIAFDHNISPVFPAIFHTGSDRMMAVGTAWERG